MRKTLAFLLLFMPLSAYAYIGPGLGAGTIGVVFGVLLAIILTFFAILWYPFKRLFKKLKKTNVSESKNDSSLS